MPSINNNSDSLLPPPIPGLELPPLSPMINNDAPKMIDQTSSLPLPPLSQPVEDNNNTLPEILPFDSSEMTKPHPSDNDDSMNSDMDSSNLRSNGSAIDGEVPFAPILSSMKFNSNSFASQQFHNAPIISSSKKRIKINNN